MLRLEPRDGVTVIHLENGENRFSRPFLAALGEALTTLEPKALPVVITGSQKFFSNGLDLDTLGDDGEAQMTGIYRLLGRIVAFPGATVAAVNGHAFGAGTMLAAACDFRVMREDRGYFCFPEVDIGVPFTPELDALLQAKYSRASLCEGWLTGKRYSGPEARALGFVDEVAGEAEVLTRAVARAAALAGKNGAMVRTLKRTLFAGALRLLEGPTPA